MARTRTRQLPPPHERLGPAHPLALLVLALIAGAGALAWWLRVQDGADHSYVHFLVALQLALLPPLYGVAHNAGRRRGKAVALLIFVTATAFVTWIYADLASPREVVVDQGYQARPEEPAYYLPPALLVCAAAAMAAHWVLSAVRAIGRGRR